MKKLKSLEEHDINERLAKDDKVTINVEISNLTEHQAKQFKKMLYYMDMLGSHGHSTDFKVAVDGDGGARAKVKIDGKSLKDSDIDFKEGADADGDIKCFGFE